MISAVAQNVSLRYENRFQIPAVLNLRLYDCRDEDVVTESYRGSHDSVNPI